MKKTILTLGILLAFTLISYSQKEINGYANVTSISNRTIQCDHLDETWDSFEEGDIIMLYQVQDNVIGYTSNNSQFGNIGSIKSAGLIEFAKIENISKSGSYMTIELEDDLTETFHTGSKSRLQVITYPTFIEYSTDSDIIAKDWDGYIGGIIAFNVEGELTVNHNISADGAGFRGGSVSTNKEGNCSSTVYRSNSNEYGEKGEGIYHSTNSSYDYGKGKILNGGGGGNHHNGGGAGGGNFSSGGSGSPGWQCTTNTGGVGGTDLSAYIINEENRAFLGGGGGGSQQNNDHGSNGGNGGGLIFIKAGDITVNSGSPSISANGNSAQDSYDDGAGGGGAGGAVLIITELYSINPSATLSIEANGGSGGNVNHSDKHGAGGGGGTGTAKFFKADPNDFSGVDVYTSVGDAGKRSYDSAPYSGGSGDSADGKLDYSDFGGNLGHLLPVELIDQNVTCNNDYKTVSWATASETNNEYFMLESSADMQNWGVVEIVPGAGNSLKTLEYAVNDHNTLNNYYRLSQTDFNGDREYFEIMHANCSDTENETAFSYKQVDGTLNVRITSDSGNPVMIRLLDMKGNVLISKQTSDVECNIPTQGINSGIYIIQVSNDQTVSSEKIIIL